MAAVCLGLKDHHNDVLGVGKQRKDMMGIELKASGLGRDRVKLVLREVRLGDI
jgi:hypothetical protein